MFTLSLVFQCLLAFKLTAHRRQTGRQTKNGCTIIFYTTDCILTTNHYMIPSRHMALYKCVLLDWWIDWLIFAVISHVYIIYQRCIYQCRIYHTMTWESCAIDCHNTDHAASLCLVPQPGTHFPTAVRDLSSSSCFCRHLKTEIFSRAYGVN